MSLFQLREWWRVHQGAESEEFDQGSLCIGNVDNSPRGALKIVTGSFSGNLRIYLPKTDEYAPSDLLLEKSLGRPILQLECGRFQLGVPNTLAVLHPKALVVYQVQSDSTSGDNSSYLELQQLYSHSITHTAANMCFGSFGGAASNDHIFVQAYDGQVYIFDQSQLVISTHFTNFLVPGPIAYIPESDSIVTCTSAYELESYSFVSFMSAASSAPAASGGLKQATAGKTLKPSWSLVLGEFAVDIKISYFMSVEGDSSDIVAVGEHTIFVVSQSGVLKAQKRLDYHPAAAISYRLPSGNHNLIVATHTSNYLIYSGQKVVWAAKGPTIPVAIRVAAISSLDAAIVILDDEGLLTVCYLGTAPPSSVLGLAEAKEIDYAEAHARHRDLMAIIRHKGGDGADARAPVREPPGHVLIRTQVPTTINEAVDDAVELGPQQTSPSPSACTVRVFLSCTGDIPVERVTLSVHAPAPAVTARRCVVVPRVGGGSATPIMVPFDFTVEGARLPSSNQVLVTATYEGANGSMRCSTHTFSLPLALFVQMVPPLKSTAAKLTVVIAGKPPPVLSLFEDVAASSPAEGSEHSNANLVVSLRYPSHEDCTVVVGKSSSKYRLQGTSFEALWLPLHELLARLDAYFGSAAGAGSGVSVSLEEQLPLMPYFDRIDEHFALRLRKRQLALDLDAAAAQYRAVQKRLLVRLKDNRPAPIGALPVLLDETHRVIADLGQQMEALDLSLAEARCRLDCCTRLVMLCLRCRCPEMTDESYQTLCAHLSPDCLDTDEVGWQELTDASMTQLLRGPLARNARERAVVPTLNEPLTQCDLVKKHIRVVLERVEGSGGAVDLAA